MMLEKFQSCCSSGKDEASQIWMPRLLVGGSDGLDDTMRLRQALPKALPVSSLVQESHAIISMEIIGKQFLNFS